MIDFIKNLLISITSVSVFCTVVLHVIGKDNSQREIVKIGCGCLMIITLISPFIKNDLLENVGFNELSLAYFNLSDEVNNELDLYTLNIVEKEVENLILSEFNVISTVKLNENYEINSIIVNQYNKIEEISSFFSINVDKIEYIESR